ncbi:hypothetical protein HDV00_002501, partial [Rhizophlyctis rosea]
MSVFATQKPALDANARDKVIKATTDLSDVLLHTLNEASLGMYRVQEHVHKKVPQLVADKHDLQTTSQSITRATSDLHDAHTVIRSWNSIDSFEKAMASLNRIKSVKDVGVGRRSTAVRKSTIFGAGGWG